MRLSVAVAALLVVPAATQTTDPILSIILSEAASIYSSVTSALASSASLSDTASTTNSAATGDSTTAGTISSTSPLSRSTVTAATGLSSSDTGTVTVATPDVSSASLASSSITTQSSDIPTSTSTATTSSSPSSSSLAAAGSSSNHATSNYRVAAIVVGSVLGALILGLLILLATILVHRRRRQSLSREDSLIPNNYNAAHPGSGFVAGPTSNRGSQVWFGSAGRKADPQGTSRPLMSEGSARYGLNSPRLRDQAGLIPQVQTGSGHNNDTDDRAADGFVRRKRNSRFNGRSSEIPSRASMVTRGASAASNGRSSRDRHRYSLLSEEGEVSEIRDARAAPDLHRSAAGAHKRKGSVFADDFSAPRQDPLNSHPTTAADLAAVESLDTGRSSGAQNVQAQQYSTQGDFLDVPTATGNGGSESGSSLSREGFATAIAGLTLDPLDEVEAQDPGQGGSEDRPRVMRSDSDPAELSGMPTSTAVGPLDHTAQRESLPTARPQTARLEIPSILQTGRNKSRRARFSDNGGVSPPTGSWLDTRDSDPRQSMISPISPERGPFRGYSYSPPRDGSTTFDTFIDQAPRSAPMTTSYPVPPLVTRDLGDQSNKRQQPEVIPRTASNLRTSEMRQQQYEAPKYQPAEYTRDIGQPSSYSTPPIRRKAVPSTASPIPRKPVPASLQIPTSKYNSSIPRQQPPSVQPVYHSVPQSAPMSDYNSRGPDYHSLVTSNPMPAASGKRREHKYRRAEHNRRGEYESFYEPQRAQHITNWWDDDEPVLSSRPTSNVNPSMNSQYARMYGGLWATSSPDSGATAQQPAQRQSYIPRQYPQQQQDTFTDFQFGWERRGQRSNR